MAIAEPPPHQGVRKLKVRDQLPASRIVINGPAFDFEKIVANKRVLDVGCGYGRNRAIVERLGGEWVGLEPFEGGAHIVVGSAEDLPFPEDSFDVVVMDCVLEHVLSVEGAFNEASRVLRPGGVFIGEVSFMECFHEISYYHVSYMALEHNARRTGMEMEVVAGGRRFGIDHHISVILYPIPTAFLSWLIAATIRGIFRVKSLGIYLVLRLARRYTHKDASDLARDYFRLECLRQSVSFSFLIRKKASDEPAAAKA